MPLEKCVVVCNSSHYGRRVVEDLQEKIQRGSATFVWTCSRITISKEGGYVKSVTDGLVVLAEGFIRLICGVEAAGYYPSSGSALPYEVMESVPAKSLTVKKSPKNPHLVSMEPVAESTGKLSIQMLLPTADIRDRFIEHFSSHAAPTYNSQDDADDEPPPPGDDDDEPEPIFSEDAVAVVPPLSTPPATALIAPEPRRASPPSIATVAGTSSPSQPSTLLGSCDTDYFHVADHKSFCTKALSKWSKWWRASEKDSEKSSIFDTLLLRSKRPSMRENGKKNASKMTQVLLSCDAQLSKSSHELVVVTDTALFIVKRRDPAIVKAFLPICGIECIQLGASEKTLSSGEVVMEWVVMVVLDLQLPVMTTSEDLKLRMDTRNKNLLTSILSRRFEAIKFARLPVTIQEDQLFWRKRTFLETKALRFAGKVKNTVMLEGLLRSSSEVEGPLSVMHATALTTKVAFCAHTLELIDALCEHSSQKASTARTSDEEKGFMARSTLTVAKELGVETPILLSCMSFEVLRIRRGAFTTSTTAKRRQPAAVSGFLRSGELLDHIMLEHCGNTGEQYLRVQLSQMFEEFLHSPKQLLPDLEYVRYVRELAELLHGSEHYDALFPRVFKDMMTVIQVIVRKHLGGAPSDIVNSRALLLCGDFVTRFFLSPAIEAPQAHGLVSEALELTQLQNLRIISKLFAALHTSGVEESELKGLGLINGFLNSGSKEDVTATRVLRSAAFRQMQEQCGPQLLKFFSRQCVDRSNQSVRTMEHLLEDLLRGGVASKVSVVALSPSDNIEMLESFHRLMEPVTMGLLCSAWAQQQQRRDDDEMKNRQEVSKPVAPQALLLKAHEENRLLASRLTDAERTAEHHKTQWAASSESFRELKATLAHKDEEILRLRTMLREMDPHYFPRPMAMTGHSFEATTLQTPPPLPHQRVEDSPFLYHYQLPLASKHLAVSSSSVFGCPLDSYHVHSAYSPQEGAIEPSRM